jgi:cellobiose phosphorylase
MRRKFRGLNLTITVKNPSGVSRGLASLTVDGKPVSGEVIPVAALRDGAQIVAILG